MSRLAIVGVSLLVSLILIEAFLRWKMPYLKPYTQADETYGFWNIPNAEFHAVAAEHCPAWERRGRINSKGLMDVEHDYDPPPDTFRVLALGDSYTEAVQFEAESGWTKRLESRLNTELKGDTHYEVINAGRSGMGAGLEYLYYVNEAHRYHASLVLVLFIPNDYEDDNKALISYDRPYIVFDGDQMRIDNSFLNERRYQIRKQTDFLRQNFLTVALLRQVYSLMDTARQTDGVDDMDSVSDLETQPLSDVERNAVTTTHRILSALHDSVAAAGATFVLIHGSSSFQVYGERSPNDPPTLRDTDRLLTDFATQAGFNYLNLVPILRQAAQNGHPYIHGCESQGPSGHWSRDGQAIAADTIFDYLVNSGFLPAERQE